MLSDREKRWVWIGGALVLTLLYLWLVLFPLIGYHRKMARRIERSWDTMRKLEGEIGRYARVALPVQRLVLRATRGNRKVPMKEQIRLLATHVLGQSGGNLSFSFATKWEGGEVSLRQCNLRGRATPAQVIQLIQRIDRNYMPMRVGMWHLEHLQGGVGALSMRIYFLEAAEK